LLPDGKAQVTVEYHYGKPARVDTVVVSTQHASDVPNAEIEPTIVESVVRRVIPGNLLDSETRMLINPSGRFEIGGPMADAGLTGRKIIVDTYGGMARHGGGAFSGKDATKVDRSAAYAARYVAKNIVAAGLAERFEIQVSYAIGKARPVSIMIETFGTGRIPDSDLLQLIDEHFDLRPAAIIESMQLKRPIFQQTAAYGHFGRDDIDVPWERTDKAVLLAQSAAVMAGSSD
jgi:S-adenosylmethionine synthetase